MPRPATGRSSRTRRSSPGHEDVGIIEKAGPGATLHQVGDRVAIAWLGIGVRTLPVLRQRPGDAVRVADQQRLLGGRRLGGVRGGRRQPRRGRPRRGVVLRRRAADLRRRHDVQGGQGLGDPARRTGRGLRRRRPGTPRRAVREDLRRPGDRRRRRGRQARPRPGPRRRPRGERAHDRPRAAAVKDLGGADVAIALRRRPALVRAGVLVAPPWRTAGLRRAAGRRQDDRPDLRHRSRRALDHRVDRRHQAGPRRRVRAARGGTHEGRRRGPPSGRRQPLHRRGARGQGPGPAGLHVLNRTDGSALGARRVGLGGEAGGQAVAWPPASRSAPGSGALSLRLAS